MTTIRVQQPAAVTGVQLAQGIGVQEAKGFWAEAWSQVLKSPRAVAALAWLAVVAFFAVIAPIIASSHPIVMRETVDGVARTTSPLLNNLEAIDLALLLGSLVAIPYIFIGPGKSRATRLGHVLLAGVVVALSLIAAAILQGQLQSRDLSPTLKSIRDFARSSFWSTIVLAAAIAAPVTLVAVVLPILSKWSTRVAVPLVAAAIAIASIAVSWNRPTIQSFGYEARERSGQITAKYTLIPFSPNHRYSGLDRREPGTTLTPEPAAATQTESPAPTVAPRTFYLGTDAAGQCVLSQLLHACRLSISIGLVSTGISVIIGVVLGAIMGYFGGWIDLLLFRVVEIFQAVPVLFLLIVAAAVLPPELRSTYVMMAIIGLFSWTTAAKFTRAEFMKLRSQDFVQSAKSVGLPLRSILFKHMLPNGVTPVLVDASFAIAAAIAIEATLSFLGLGPTDQPSWGTLLASAVSSEGVFKWWLAVFPGAAMFLTVLAYNLIGEALRDAIDPKLKKARV